MVTLGHSIEINSNQTIKVLFTKVAEVTPEFYNVMTGKMKKSTLKAKDSLRFFQTFESAAQAANCSIILSENLSDGQSIEGIAMQNPLTFKVE